MINLEWKRIDDHAHVGGVHKICRHKHKDFQLYRNFESSTRASWPFAHFEICLASHLKEKEKEKGCNGGSVGRCGCSEYFLHLLNHKNSTRKGEGRQALVAGLDF